MTDEKWYNDDKEKSFDAVMLEAEYDVEAKERELVIIALLMRLYDVNLGLLKETNPTLAEEIYEEHAAGGNFNPAIFVPDFAQAADPKETTGDE